jgi:hypothetical protein
MGRITRMKVVEVHRIDQALRIIQSAGDPVGFLVDDAVVVEGGTPADAPYKAYFFHVRSIKYA